MAEGLDLGPVLDVAGGVLLRAIETAGTVGGLWRPTGPPVVDPDTTLRTDPPMTLLAGDVPMLVIADAPGGQERIYPGAREAQDPRWRVILGPTLVDVRRGDVVLVTASRDERLVGARFDVSVLLDNAAGVARRILATRAPERGQT
jgi:hypothetical protein